MFAFFDGLPQWSEISTNKLLMYGNMDTETVLDWCVTRIPHEAHDLKYICYCAILKETISAVLRRLEEAKNRDDADDKEKYRTLVRQMFVNIVQKCAESEDVRIKQVFVEVGRMVRFGSCYWIHINVYSLEENWLI